MISQFRRCQQFVIRILGNGYFRNRILIIDRTIFYFHFRSAVRLYHCDLQLWHLLEFMEVNMCILGHQGIACSISGSILITAVGGDRLVGKYLGRVILTILT